MPEIKITSDTVNIDGEEKLEIKGGSSLKWSQIGKKPTGTREEPPTIVIPTDLRMVD